MIGFIDDQRQAYGDEPILEGRSNMPDVAHHLGVGPRSLRRALAREDTTFEAVRDAVRVAVARDLLSMSTLSVGDLASMLDFASPATFIQAFRRWTGDTPAAWREKRSRSTTLTAGTRE